MDNFEFIITTFLQLGTMDKKLDALTHILNSLAQKNQAPFRSIEDDVWEGV